MKDQNIAKVYAQSFLELGQEKNIDIAEEVTKITEVINASNDLENVLFLDVFTVEEKKDVFLAIAEKLGTSVEMKAAVKFLIEEKRINLFPLIFKEIIVIDDHKKGFLRGTIEGASDSISEEYKSKLIAIIKKEVGGSNPVLDYKQNKDVTAGYKITVDDLQLDASVDNQLKQFKSSVLGE